MDAPWQLDNAPITKAALWRSLEDSGPAPIEMEWASLVERPGDVILLWAGAMRRKGHEWPRTWVWVSWHVGEEGTDTREPNVVIRTPASSVERLLSPLAHEARVRLMQVIYDGPKTSGQLAEVTGLRGGNLYYHLKELMHAAYVKEKDGAYDLTPLGCQMLITVTAIAGKLVSDRGEEGLLVGADWNK